MFKFRWLICADPPDPLSHPQDPPGPPDENKKKESIIKYADPPDPADKNAKSVPK